MRGHTSEKVELLLCQTNIREQAHDCIHHPSTIDSVPLWLRDSVKGVPCLLPTKQWCWQEGWNVAVKLDVGDVMLMYEDCV